LSDGERETLERLARAQSVPHRQVLQARVLLLAADGVANAVIAEDVGVTPVTVRAWRARFVADGLAGLEKIRDGRGRKPSISEETVAEVVRLTTTTKPPGATHWSCRTMAKQVGVSSATVQRIWSDLGLAPHRVETFKVSNDPKFEDRLVDVDVAPCRRVPRRPSTIHDVGQPSRLALSKALGASSIAARSTSKTCGSHVSAVFQSSPAASDTNMLCVSSKV
jgi:transposase